VPVRPDYRLVDFLRVFGRTEFGVFGTALLHHCIAITKDMESP